MPIDLTPLGFGELGRIAGARPRHTPERSAWIRAPTLMGGLEIGRRVRHLSRHIVMPI